MTLKEANGKWMDIRGVAGMVLDAGWGIGDGEGGGDGANEGATAGGGNAVKVGSAGRIDTGEASSPPARSSSAGSNRGGEAVNDVWEREGEGSENGSSKAVQDRGERRSWPSPTSPCSSSTSLRHLLVHFAGGVLTSGDERGGTGCWRLGGVDDTASGGGVETLLLAEVAAAGSTLTATVAGEWSVLAPTVVAARPRIDGDDDGGGASQQWWRSW